MTLATHLLAHLLVCLRFCSRLPLPVLGFETSAHDLSAFAQAVRMLPAAGGIIGGLSAIGLMIAASLGLEPRIASALAVGTSVLLTGALHEDGLADSADGLGGGKTPERKLEIMRDSRIGTYGVITIVLTLYLRVESVASIAEESLALAVAALVAAAALSRAAMLAPLVLLRPARADGSGHAAGRPESGAVAIALGLATVMALLPISAGASPWAALVAISATGGVALGITGLAHRHIDGQTGDIAGAAQQLSEVAILLAYAGH